MRLRLIVRDLFVTDIVLLFTVSGGLLWDLGLNYDGISGAMASKIHPATYLAFAAFSLLLLARRNPVSIFAELAKRERGSLIMVTATAAVLAFAILTKRPGIAGLIDTFWLPAVLVTVAGAIDPQAGNRASPVLHAILACNALLTVFEFASGIDLIPYRFEGMTLYDDRPAGLQGIAVENALIIGTYLMVLLANGAARFPRNLRTPAILLQVAALLACQERFAAILGGLVIGTHAASSVLRGLTGARVRRTRAAGIAVAIPIGIIILLFLAHIGTFDSFLDRFRSDGGSAMARFQMFLIISHLPLSQILFAPDISQVETLRQSYGLSLGIENPVVHFVLYQGAIATTMLAVGLFFLLRDLTRRLYPSYGWPLFYFLATIMSYESIGTKTTVLAKFTVLLLALCSRNRPGPLPLSGQQYSPLRSSAATSLMSGRSR